MRKVSLLPKRSTASIVQQMNTQCTRDVLLQLANGVTNLDINPGSQARSYDFEDQTKVDFDAPYLGDSSSLIDQSIRSKELYDHIHPTPPDDPTAPGDPTPPLAEPDPSDVTTQA